MGPLRSSPSVGAVTDAISQRESTEATGDKIREAAKWFIASSAAVGAALIAGSQLSSIGKLDACWGFSLRCGRLGIALLGAVIGLAGVVWAIALAIGILMPRSYTSQALAEEGRKRKSPMQEFFSKEVLYLQGFSTLEDMTQKEARAFQEFDRAASAYRAASARERPAKLEEVKARRSELVDIEKRADAVIQIANQVSLEHDFKRALRKLISAAAVSAVGIGAFAWAGNPPEEKPTSTVSLRRAKLRNVDLTGTNLQGADLRDADLTGANFTGADLTGAKLEQARLDGAIWSKTTCPDGKKSDDVGGSCINHLSTAATSS